VKKHVAPRRRKKFGVWSLDALTGKKERNASTRKNDLTHVLSTKLKGGDQRGSLRGKRRRPKGISWGALDEEVWWGARKLNMTSGWWFRPWQCGAQLTGSVQSRLVRQKEGEP